jgi:hypothetical protein
MPDTADRLLQALGQPDLALDSAEYGARPGGAQVGDLAPLFPRIDAGGEAAA